MLDLHRACYLLEGSTCSRKVRYQGVMFDQDEKTWGFSSELLPTRKPYSYMTMESHVAPILGGAARAIHDRIRRQMEAPTEASSS